MISEVFYVILFFLLRPQNAVFYLHSMSPFRPATCLSFFFKKTTIHFIYKMYILNTIRVLSPWKDLHSQVREARLGRAAILHRVDTDMLATGILTATL